MGDIVKICDNLCDGTRNFDRDRDQKRDQKSDGTGTRNLTGPGPRSGPEI